MRKNYKFKKSSNLDYSNLKIIVSAHSIEIIKSITNMLTFSTEKKETLTISSFPLKDNGNINQREMNGQKMKKIVKNNNEKQGKLHFQGTNSKVKVIIFLMG